MRIAVEYLVEAERLQRLTLHHIVLLRDFLLGYLEARGGEAKIDELVDAVKSAPRYGILVPASPAEVRHELNYLTALGILERIDGRVRLRREKMKGSLKRKVERLAALVAPITA